MTLRPKSNKQKRTSKKTSNPFKRYPDITIDKNQLVIKAHLDYNTSTEAIIRQIKSAKKDGQLGGRSTDINFVDIVTRNDPDCLQRADDLSEELRNMGYFPEIDFFEGE
jgi:hypothetical protein